MILRRVRLELLIFGRPAEVFAVKTMHGWMCTLRNGRIVDISGERYFQTIEEARRALSDAGAVCG